MFHPVDRRFILYLKLGLLLNYACDVRRASSGMRHLQHACAGDLQSDPSRMEDPPLRKHSQ